MDLAKLKTELAAANQRLAAAKAKVQETPDDANAVTELNEASSAVIDLSGQYTKALEENQPLQTDIDKLIREAKESTRQEEKDKLYAQIKKAQEERDAIKADMDKKIQEALDEHAKKQDKLDGEGDRGDNLTQKELDKILDERLKAIKDEHANELKQQSQKAENELAVLRKELQVKELEEYKREAIAKSGDSIVQEMVSGNTKEEIDASIVKAKQAWEKIANSVARRNADRRGGLPNPLPAGNDDNLPGDGPTAAEIEAMSAEEYVAWKKSPAGRQFFGGH